MNTALLCPGPRSVAVPRDATPRAWVTGGDPEGAPASGGCLATAVLVDHRDAFGLVSV